MKHPTTCRFYAAFRDLLLRWTTPTAPPEKDIVRYWQDRLLFALLLGGVVLGFLVYIPSFALSIREGLWVVAVADTMIYGWVVFLFFRRSLPFWVRSHSVVVLTCVLGIVLLSTRASFNAGPVWLFAFPVLAAIFMGLKGSLVALTMNACIMGTLGIFIGQDLPLWSAGVLGSPEKWVVVTLNFIFLNGIVAISAGFIARGLAIALGHEKKISVSLERKHGELLGLNRQLEAEIVERKRAESAFKESQERYNALFHRSFDLVFVLDLDGNFLDCNDVFLKRLGYSRNALCAANFLSLLYEDQEGIARERLREIRETGSQRIPVVYRMKSNQGEDVYIECTGAMIHHDGIPCAVQGIGRDVTDRKRQEVQRRNLERQLHQVQKMEAIGTLAGGIAHDFNNILSSVIGFAELSIRDVEKGTPLEGYLMQIYQAGERARDLVGQILTFARQGDEEVRPTRVSLIVKEALKMLRATIPASIEIKQDIRSNAWVMANSTQIHQIIMNLSTNAAQAMEDRGGVLRVLLHEETIGKPPGERVDALKPGPYLKMEVCDTGKGIDKESLDSIFDPYYTTKPPGEGTGLGLSVVHGIVSRCGGRISVKSVKDQGTVFTIFLPVVQKAAMKPAGNLKRLPSGNESILFVDDEAPLVEMAQQMLEQLGYSVTALNSSLEALELFCHRPDDFDLVISDMQMPHMNGDHLASKLLSVRPDIPIILCTGYSKKITEESAADLGVKSLAYKPLTISEMANTVRKVLDEVKKK